MRVKAVYNTGLHLPKDCLDATSGFSEDTTFPLNISNDYVVYGMTKFLGYMWYYILDEASTYYPRWNPSPLFEVVDNRISKYWKYKHDYNRDTQQDIVIFAFEEWVNDDYFYDSLTDGDENTVSIFNKYKDLMMLEFSDSTKDIALKLSGNWIMCPHCDEVWEVNNLNGLLKCQKCSLFINNPFCEASFTTSP